MRHARAPRINPCCALVRVLFFAAALLVLHAASTAMAARGKPLDDYAGHPGADIEVNGDKARIYDLHLTKGVDELVESAPHYTVLYRGKQVAEGNYVDIKEHFPKPGLVTVMVGAFSGGAYCCWEYTLLTIDTADRSVLRTSLDAGGPSMEYDEGFFEPDGRIRFGNWDFFNYTTSKGRLSISLFPAVSPKMTRYLVYDNGRWRADRPREFAQEYLALLRPLIQLAPDEYGSQALKIAYYSVMAGLGQQEATAAVAKALGPKRAPLAPTVLADVQQAIAKNTFVDNARLGDGQGAGQAATTPAATTAPSPQASDDAAQCRQQAKTPCAYAACLADRLKFWDDALNKRFRELMRAFPEDRRAALKREEIAWVKDYMRLQASLKSKKDGPCPDQADYQAAMVEWVRQRTLVLQAKPTS